MRFVYIIGLVLVIALSATSQRIQPGSSKKKTVEEEVTIDTNLVIQAYLSNPDLQSEIPKQLEESSGLKMFRDGILSHNDSGGEPKLYKLDTLSGEIVQTIRIENASNKDWEDITADSLYLYIGDFGNNGGNRKNLCIYIVKKSDIPESGDVNVTAGILNFHFEDQQNFNNEFVLHNFDCESVIAFENNLYLFSKNWMNQETRVYKLPKTAGDHTAKKIGEFNAYGLITGADIDQDANRIVLIGYHYNTPFVWHLLNFSGDDFFSGINTRIDLPYIHGAQTEGITFIDSANVFISCENSKYTQQLFNLDVYYWEKNYYKDERDPVIDDAWTITLFGKKKKNELYMAIDVTGLQDIESIVWVEDWQNNPRGFPGYHFEKHMGKVYLKYDAHLLKRGDYEVNLKAGRSLAKKEIYIP